MSLFMLVGAGLRSRVMAHTRVGVMNEMRNAIARSRSWNRKEREDKFLRDVNINPCSVYQMRRL